MTIDEAIKHAEAKAKELKEIKEFNCSNEHKLLAEWLKELKELKNINKTQTKS